MDPRAVSWELVSTAGTAAAREANAKYIISVSRKLGLSTFLLWEDIVSVNYKAMVQLAASLLCYSQSKR